MEAEDLIAIFRAALPMAGLAAIGVFSLRLRAATRETNRLLRELDRTLAKLSDRAGNVSHSAQPHRKSRPDPSLN